MRFGILGIDELDTSKAALLGRLTAAARRYGDDLPPATDDVDYWIDGTPGALGGRGYDRRPPFQPDRSSRFLVGFPPEPGDELVVLTIVAGHPQLPELAIGATSTTYMRELVYAEVEDKFRDFRFRLGPHQDIAEHLVGHLIEALGDLLRDHEALVAHLEHVMEERDEAIRRVDHLAAQLTVLQRAQGESHPALKRNLMKTAASAVAMLSSLGIPAAIAGVHAADTNANAAREIAHIQATSQVETAIIGRVTIDRRDPAGQLTQVHQLAHELEASCPP